LGAQLNSIKKIVQTDLDQVDQLINSELHSDIDLINEISANLLQTGGKRLRPLIMLLITHACGYKGKHHHHIAAVIELIHAATLLHDDVIDNSIQRRGKPTANKQWGNQAAILAGDYIYSRAFQIMVKVGNIEVLEILANSANKIAEGEILQLIEQRNSNTTQEQYLEIIYYKTAKLFEAATTIGAVLGDSDVEICDNAALYGKHFGIAYQIVDDVLDYTAKTDDLGKNQGNDLIEGRVTLPLVYLLKNGNTKEKDLITRALEDSSGNLFAEVKNIVMGSSAIEYSLDIARSEVTKAKQALDGLEESEYLQGCKDLAEFVLERGS